MLRSMSASRFSFFDGVFISTYFYIIFTGRSVVVQFRFVPIPAFGPPGDYSRYVVELCEALFFFFVALFRPKYIWWERGDEVTSENPDTEYTKKQEFQVVGGATRGEEELTKTPWEWYSVIRSCAPRYFKTRSHVTMHPKVRIIKILINGNW